MMSQNAHSKGGSRCGPWDCNEPVDVGTSICKIHRDLYLPSQNGPTHPRSDVPLPSTQGVHTAKRTKRFFVRRPSSSRQEQPQTFTGSNATSSGPNIIETSRRSMRDTLQNGINPSPVAPMSSQALPQPLGTLRRDSPAMNGNMPPNSYGDGLYRGPANQPPIPSMGIPLSIIVDSGPTRAPTSNVTEHRVPQGYNSATTVAQGHQTRPRIPDGPPLVPPTNVDVVNQKPSTPLESSYKSSRLPISSLLTDPVTPRREKAYPPGRPSIVVEIQSKGRNNLASWEDLDTSSHNINKSEKPTTQVETFGRTQHARGNLNMSQSNSSDRIVENLIRSQALRPSPIPSTTPTIKKTASPVQKGKTSCVPVDISSDSDSDVEITYESKANPRASMQPLVQPAMPLTMDLTSSPAQHSSEKHERISNGCTTAPSPLEKCEDDKKINAGFTTALFPPVECENDEKITARFTTARLSPRVDENQNESDDGFFPAHSPPKVFSVPQSPHQGRPSLAPQRSSSKQSVPTRSTSHSVAPSTPRTDISLVQKTKVPSRISIEERQNALILKFDSMAFDTMIYRQSSMRPPPGITIPVNKHHGQQSISTPAPQEERMYLPTNPVIHRLHNRSDAWQRAKEQEIKDRRGRKYWFGKVAERERWLRTREAEKEEKITASKGGELSLRRDPQPWTYDRPIDFGDVPEDKLPDDVLQDPAWMRACAWHREKKNRSVRRQRAVHSANQQVRDQFLHVLKDAQSGSKKRRHEGT